MAGFSETDKRDLEYNISGRNIKNFMEALQVAGQLSADNVLQTLKLLEVKILNNELETPLCQKVTDLIVGYLRKMKPEGELEEMCTAVLMALGSQFPGMVITKLWDRQRVRKLPPRGLLVTVGKLSLCQDIARYIDATWEYILRILRMAKEEDDMLAICHVLYGLVVSTQKHLDPAAKHEGAMDIREEAVAIKAYQTLRVLFNRWSLKSKDKVTEQVLVVIGRLFYLIPPFKLKNQVNWLTRWLMSVISTKVTPFYISQCIFQLVDALALSGCGGINLEYQLENITDMLFNQLNEKVNNSDSHSVLNHSLAQRAFCILTKLYSDQVVFLLQKTMESKDPAKTVSALQVFVDVFQEVPQTEKLQSKVMHSVINMIQEDFEPVRKPLLNFIEMLGQHNYFALPLGDIIINYIVKLSQSDSSNEEDIRIMCFKILKMVSLPKLVTLACEPNNISVFVPLSKIASEMAVRARLLGHVPYLSSFHHRPAQFISPQKLMIHLVMLYRVDKFKPGSTLRKEIYTFLVPLLLSFQDNNAEVVKACGGALTKWTKVIGWSSLTQMFQHTTLSDHMQVLEETCKYLVSTCKKQFLGELLRQSFDFLKSPWPFLRAAAITFIGLTAKKINMNNIHEDDVQLLKNALESLRNDPVESIQSLVNTTLTNIDKYVKAGLVPTSKMSRLSINLFKVSGMKASEKKKRLFKTVRRERDDEDSQKNKVWNWLQTLNSLRSWRSGRVKITPLIVGDLQTTSTGSQAPNSKSPSEETEPVQKKVAPESLTVNI
uniref:Uncharacterized protein n=1 Tax=Rousettus aegyptiacus TaxID=9407 RepID=A0A7J8JG75_ROUAE|nr:hypothetical protein HJG63_010212 [Rousettus aegyptiacus]